MMFVFFRIPKTVVTFLRGLRRGKKRKEKFSTVFPCNSLISLVSDERIQGNPRKSKAHNRGFLQRNRPAPRKPKR